MKLCASNLPAAFDPAHAIELQGGPVKTNVAQVHLGECSTFNSIQNNKSDLHTFPAAPWSFDPAHAAWEARESACRYVSAMKNCAVRLHWMTVSGATKEMLAEHLEVTETTVARWTNNKSQPDLPSITEF